MATDLKLREKRRGERVLIRVPVHLQAVGEDGSEIIEPGEAVVVSRFGALLRTVSRLKKASTLSVTNGFTQETEKFKVVWVADKQTEGRWDTGVEADSPREDFWGIRFPPKEIKEKAVKA
jgi:regulator of protease activity HflC (stomatin/prohibitin superfamily)